MQCAMDAQAFRDRVAQYRQSQQSMMEVTQDGSETTPETWLHQLNLFYINIIIISGMLTLTLLPTIFSLPYPFTRNNHLVYENIGSLATEPHTSM